MAPNGPELKNEETKETPKNKNDNSKEKEKFEASNKKTKELHSKTEEEHKKDEAEADKLISPEEIKIKENEDKDINNFFYMKGRGQPGDIVVSEPVRGLSPIYRYNKETKSYDDVMYTAHKNMPESVIKQRQSEYKWHEITDKEEQEEQLKIKEKIPADLEDQLNKISAKKLLETGDGKLFNIVWENWMEISDDSVKIFKSKINQLYPDSYPDPNEKLSCVEGDFGRRYFQSAKAQFYFGP